MKIGSFDAKISFVSVEKEWRSDRNGRKLERNAKILLVLVSFIKCKFLRNPKNCSNESFFEISRQRPQNSGNSSRNLFFLTLWSRFFCKNLEV